MSVSRKALRPTDADLPASTPAVRDAGLQRLRRLNRWLVAGAVGCTAVLSAVVAGTSNGHAASAAPSAAVSTAAGVPAASSSGETSPPSAGTAEPAPAAPSAVVTGAS